MAGGGLGVAHGGICWLDGGCVAAEKGLGRCYPATGREVGEREKRNVCESVLLG